METVIGLTAIAVALLIGLGALGVGIGIGLNVGRSDLGADPTNRSIQWILI